MNDEDSPESIIVGFVGGIIMFIIGFIGRFFAVIALLSLVALVMYVTGNL